MKKLNLLFITVILLSLGACNQKVDVEADLASINNAREQLINAMNTDDVDAIMDVLSEDHITMAPDEPAYLDMAKLRSYHEARIKLLSFQAEFLTEDIQLSGDWAFEYFTNKTILTPKGEGDIIRGIGKGIWIWQRQQDGDWKLSRSIWNSNESQ